MFDNIGGKMKWLAWACFTLGMVASAIYAVVAGIASRNLLTALLTFAVLFLVVWVGSWATYALGEAADNIDLQERIRMLD